MNMVLLRPRISNIDDILSVVTVIGMRSIRNKFFKHRKQFYHYSSLTTAYWKVGKNVEICIEKQSSQQTTDKSNTLDISKLIGNLFDRILSAYEISFLKMGLHFNINGRQFSPFNIITRNRTNSELPF